jgi:fructokinase
VSDGPIVVWGEVLWDRFPTGDLLGGAPANVAWHLGMAGNWSVLATRVGNDEWGLRAIERLQLYVDTALVQRDATRATGEVTVTVVDAEARYRLVPDRAWEHIEFNVDVRDALAEAAAFVYGTLAQRTPAGFEQWRLAIAAAPAGCIKVCDPNLRGEITKLSAHEAMALQHALRCADIIKINDREVAALRDICNWADPVATLLEQPRIVAVTHGDKGSTLHRRNPDGSIATHRIAGVAISPLADSQRDNVGCGDAYVAIFVHGLLEGWNLEDSARAANAWAALVASERGATPIFDDDVIATILGEGSYQS